SMQQIPAQQTWSPRSPQMVPGGAGDQSVRLRAGSQTSQTLPGLAVPAATMVPAISQGSGSHWPSSPQRYPGSQQVPVQQTWSPLAPHGSSDRGDHANWSSTGSHHSHGLASLTANSAISTSSIRQPHIPQTPSVQH